MKLVFKEPLLQEDVAAYTRVYVQAKPVGMGEQWQWQVQAAMVAGWIVEPEVAVEKRVDMETGKERMVYLLDGVEVGKMSAGVVRQMGRQCDQAFTAATTVPDSKN